MKSKITVFGLSFLVVSRCCSHLAQFNHDSCFHDATYTTTTSVITTTSTASVTNTSTTSTTPITVTATPVSTGNWWDNLGTPIYGGTMTMCLNGTITTWTRT